jgi:hypothetical protein
MTPADILTAITLGVSGWTLLKVIKLSEDVSAMRERVRNIDQNNPKIIHENRT